MKRSIKFLPRSHYVFALLEGVIVAGFIVAAVELPDLLVGENASSSTIQLIINLVMIFFVSFANRLLLDNYELKRMDNTHWKCIFLAMGIAFLIVLTIMILIK